ncbi:MAG: hypothetical protein U9Q06_04755 [Nanoarchaeota archaeon]|nr:hypothetical protein [Nanoarchaeota archaeon]
MANQKPWKDPNKSYNAYDLSSSPATRAVDERRFRKKFQKEKMQDIKRTPWEDQVKRINPYCSVEVHAMVRKHKTREDTYVNERLK